MNQGEARPPLRVALVQFKPRKAAVTANVEAVRTLVVDHAAQVDLVVFPEACLSGYFLEGGVAEAALSTERLAELLGPPPPDAPDVALGFYERWRRRLYNSAAYLTPEGEEWKVRHVHRKMFLPTYGIFDEGRFVDPGTEVRAFDTRFGRMGLLVCEVCRLVSRAAAPGSDAHCLQWHAGRIMLLLDILCPQSEHLDEVVTDFFHFQLNGHHLASKVRAVCAVNTNSIHRFLHPLGISLDVQFFNSFRTCG